MTNGKDVNGILLIRYSITKFFDIHFILFILKYQKNPGFFIGTSGILLRLRISFNPFVSEIALYRMLSVTQSALLLCGSDFSICPSRA